MGVVWGEGDGVREGLDGVVYIGIVKRFSPYLGFFNQMNQLQGYLSLLQRIELIIWPHLTRLLKGLAQPSTVDHVWAYLPVEHTSDLKD